MVWTAMFTPALAHAEGNTISPDAARTAAPGPPENFTGDVENKPLFSATTASQGGGGQITFAPGARTHWHTIPQSKR
jgi:quercetin dioxygenase-like cupin family protein